MEYGDLGNAVFAGEGRPVPDAGDGVALARDSAHTDTDDNLADFYSAAPTPGEPAPSHPDAGGPERPDAAPPPPADVGLPDAGSADSLVIDPFDERAVLVVRRPVGATAYGFTHNLRYDNGRYFVFDNFVFDNFVSERVAEAPLDEPIRLPPGTYVVVLNDTFETVEIDWNDRVEIGAGRIELVTDERGDFTVTPSERFDNLARPLALRGCGQFGNQTRSRWILGGCDGELGGGDIDDDVRIFDPAGARLQQRRVSVSAE